jgi:hypothetical protein
MSDYSNKVTLPCGHRHCFCDLDTIYEKNRGTCPDCKQGFFPFDVQWAKPLLQDWLVSRIGPAFEVVYQRFFDLARSALDSKVEPGKVTLGNGSTIMFFASSIHVVAPDGLHCEIRDLCCCSSFHQVATLDASTRRWGTATVTLYWSDQEHTLFEYPDTLCNLMAGLAMDKVSATGTLGLSALLLTKDPAELESISREIRTSDKYFQNMTDLLVERGFLSISV